MQYMSYLEYALSMFWTILAEINAKCDVIVTNIWHSFISNLNFSFLIR